MVQPEYKTKHGQIQGTVWANEKDGKKGKFTSRSIQIEKSYTTDEGKTWQKSKSFFPEDITNLKYVLSDIEEHLKSIGAKLSKNKQSD